MSDFLQDPALLGLLQELDKDRLNIVAGQRKAKIVMIAGGVLLLIVILLGMTTAFTLVPCVAILVYGFVLKIKMDFPLKLYKDTFKQKVVATALKDIDPSMVIEPLNGMSEEEFKASQLFTTSPDRYASEDQITGQADKTRFYFSEVKAEYKDESTDSDGRRQVSWDLIFDGIIFTADFNKNFIGTTVVRPKNIASTLGSWITKALSSFSDKQVVELENAEFSEKFVTYSTDQIEARYILTPAMMEKLCELNRESRGSISLSFIYSRVYIAFPMDHNYFEPPLKTSILDSDILEKDILIVRFLYDVVKELGLNTRIWGKS